MFPSLAALLTALSSIEVSIAQAKQQCSAAMPSNPQGHWWSYRQIDGRKCWYEGKPGLSKSLLEWAVEVSAPPASGEDVASTFPEKARNPLNSQAWAPNSQPSAPSDPDTFEARWRARTVEEAASVTGCGVGHARGRWWAAAEENRQAAVSLQHTGKDPRACDCSRSAASSTDRTTSPQRETPGGALPWSFSKRARIARRQSCLGETIRLQSTRIASIRATNSGRTVLARLSCRIFSDASSPPRAYPSVEE